MKVTVMEDGFADVRLDVRDLEHLMKHLDMSFKHPKKKKNYVLEYLVLECPVNADDVVTDDLDDLGLRRTRAYYTMEK